MSHSYKQIQGYKQVRSFRRRSNTSNHQLRPTISRVASPRVKQRKNESNLLSRYLLMLEAMFKDMLA